MLARLFLFHSIGRLFYLPQSGLRYRTVRCRYLAADILPAGRFCHFGHRSAAHKWIIYYFSRITPTHNVIPCQCLRKDGRMLKSDLILRTVAFAYRHISKYSCACRTAHSRPVDGSGAFHRAAAWCPGRLYVLPYWGGP